MIKLMRRWWQYMTASLTGKFNEAADPKVQLEQAITEAQEQHRRLMEQAANVIANQKQNEMRLNRAMEDMGKVRNSATQALLMADDAAKKGDTAKLQQYNQAAEAFANRLIAIEKEAESLKTLALQSAQAADQAKSAVAQNSSALQKKLSERQKLLSQLDQAKMQEQMNRAMQTLSLTVGQDVPTLDEVRDKIEARYAKALGAADLQSQTVESSMLEIEQAQLNVEAQSRLSELRSQLGLSSPAPVGEVGAGTTGAAASTPAEGTTAETSQSQ